MAKKSMILKQQAKPKFSTRAYNRCKICGRPHAYLRDFGICRMTFDENRSLLLFSILTARFRARRLRKRARYAPAFLQTLPYFVGKDTFIAF